MAKRTKTPRRVAVFGPRARTTSARAVRLVLTTSRKMDAPRIARDLVDRGVAACVSVLPGASSTYRWRGKVERAAESVLLVKTTGKALRACLARLAQVHPYEIPEALVLTPGLGLTSYVRWVVKTTAPGAS